MYTKSEAVVSSQGSDEMNQTIPAPASLDLLMDSNQVTFKEKERAAGKLRYLPLWLNLGQKIAYEQFITASYDLAMKNAHLRE